MNEELEDWQIDQQIYREFWGGKISREAIEIGCMRIREQAKNSVYSSLDEEKEEKSIPVPETT